MWLLQSWLMMVTGRHWLFPTCPQNDSATNWQDPFSCFVLLQHSVQLWRIRHCHTVRVSWVVWHVTWRQSLCYWSLLVWAHNKQGWPVALARQRCLQVMRREACLGLMIGGVSWLQGRVTWSQALSLALRLEVSLTANAVSSQSNRSLSLRLRY